MATSFPGSLDSFVNPSGSDALDSVSVPHADQHANLNDAVEALEAKVGVDGSAVTTSLDYKVAQQGLVLVKTQTVGSTAVASVAVSDAFSSQYRNYHIVYTGGNFVSIGSGSSAQLQITIPGMTSNVRTTLMYVLAPWTTLQVTSGTAAEFGFFGGGDATSVYGACTLYAPNLAEYTRYVSSTYTPQAIMAGVGNAWGVHGATTQHTGFSIVVSDSGTIANGTINVYGFNNG